MISEERLNPVENVVRNVEHGILGKKGAVANSIKGFGKINGIDDDVGIGIEEIGDSMEEVDKSCSSRSCWLESKLVSKTE